jgi:preprotein translocase subunit SecD
MRHPNAAPGAALALLTFAAFAPAAGPPPRKLPDGVYVVQRNDCKQKAVLPLRAGEALVVQHHRYLNKPANEPPRFVVVGTAPDVALVLDGKPKAIMDGTEVVGILLKLRPKAAGALERVTRQHRGGSVAIVIGGEVVTMHKVREAIRGGNVQITSCAPKAAGHLLKHLEAVKKGK